MAKIRNSVHIRRVYEKLMITVSLSPKTASVGLTQEFDGGSFSPDHALAPLSLVPTVSAAASDVQAAATWTVGSTEATSGNANLAWRVNGAAINTVWTENTDYEFAGGGKELIVKRNVATSESFTISCRLLVLDGRTGVVVPIESEQVTLSTVSATDAAPTLRLSRNNVVYDDMADDLVEWEYRSTRGISQLMTQAAATNDACYKKTLDIIFTKGSAGRQSSGFGLVVKDSANAEVARMAADASSATISDTVRINSLTRTAIEIDCRTIDRERFTVTALDTSGNEIATARDTVQVVRRHRTFDMPEIVNNSDYTASNTKYRNSVRVAVNGEELQYPEVYLAIDYFTTANQTGATEQYVGSGNYCTFDPNVAGDGTSAADNGFDMTAECDYHLTPCLALADNGTDFLTDHNGAPLLI